MAVEDNQGVYIDEKAVDKGELLKELVKGPWIDPRNNRFYPIDANDGIGIAVKGGKIYSHAMYAYDTIEDMLRRLREVGREDYYKVGISALDFGNFSPWYQMDPDDLAPIRVVTLALALIGAKEKLKEGKDE